MTSVLDKVKYNDLDPDAPALCRFIEPVVEHLFTDVISIPDMNGAENLARQATMEHCLALARDNEEHLTGKSADDNILYHMYEILEFGLQFAHGYIKGYNEANNGCRC